MYLPQFQRVEDTQTLLAFMREHPFTNVITSTSGVAAVSHIPVLAFRDGDGIRLRGHMARSNDHSALLDGDAPTVVVFQGPHAYVSPLMYDDAGAGPTWDYIAVQASGHTRVLDDDDTHEFLHELLAAFDPDFRARWDAADEALRTRMVGGIAAFEMDVTGLDAIYKLGQNRSKEGQARIASHLSASNDTNAAALGRTMAERLEQT
jgi:transcriptional regulator